jgi:ubiquinone/menaquinone biosynthesis C-methylase UbiE
MYLIFGSRDKKKNAYMDGFFSILSTYPRAGRFLEIGSANPEQIEEHRKFFGKLIGLDLDFKRLHAAPGCDKVNANAQTLPFKDGVFDGVISHHVIEHIDDDRSFIKEINRVLKNGGFAILGTPNRKRLVRVVIEIFTGERKFPWWEHKREYIKKDLHLLSDGCGFKKVSVQSKFLGLHSFVAIIGFSRCPVVLEKWCNFLFLVLEK